MIRYGEIKIRTCLNVYEPSEDTFLLANNLDVMKGDRVLEIGTGTGLVAIKASKLGEVTATDINPHAVSCARLNAKLNKATMRILEGDLFEPVSGERFDLILFNTPYLPTTDDEIIGEFIEKAWDGGPDGRRVIDRFLEGVKEHLRKGGRIQIVQSSLSNTAKTLEKLYELGFEAEVAASERFFFEEVVLINGKLMDPL